MDPQSHEGRTDRYAACLDCGSHLYHRRDCELAKGLRESAAGGATNAVHATVLYETVPLGGMATQGGTMNAVEPRREYLLRCTNPEPHRPHVTGVATNATWRCPGVKASVFTDEVTR